MQTVQDSAWASKPGVWVSGSSFKGSTIFQTYSSVATGFGTSKTKTTGYSESHWTSQDQDSTKSGFSVNETTSQSYSNQTSDSDTVINNTASYSTVETTVLARAYADTSSSYASSFSRDSSTDNDGTTTSDSDTGLTTSAVTNTGTRTQTGTATTDESGGARAKTDTITSTHEYTRTAPSTTSTSSQTGAATSDTASTQTIIKASTWTEAGTITTTNKSNWTGTNSATNSANYYTSTVTTATENSDATITTTGHSFRAIHNTVLYPDFAPNLEGVWNREKVWIRVTHAFNSLSPLSGQTVSGVFSDFWTEAGAGTVFTVDHGSKFISQSTVHRTFAYSESTDTTTSQTGAATTDTGDVTIRVKSLDGSPWDSTEAKSSSTISFNSGLAATSTTEQSSGYDTDGSWTTGTRSRAVDGTFSHQWNTWDHSSAVTDTATEYSTQEETIEIESYKSDTLNSTIRYVGLVTTTSEAVVESSFSYAWTKWVDASTRTVDQYTEISLVTGASFARGTTSTHGDSYNFTTWNHSPVGESFDLLDEYRLARPLSVRVPSLPNGWLGFGGGWTNETYAVYNAITKNKISGSEFAAWTLGTWWPAAAVIPGASAWRTDQCATVGQTKIPSAVAISFSTTGGEATGASMLITWSSTTNTGTTSEVTTVAATYAVGADDPITGDFVTVTDPEADALPMPLHRPDSDPWNLSRLTLGGYPPISSSAASLILGAGQFKYTAGDSTGGTTAGTSSSNEGPWVATFAGGASVTGWFEHGVKMGRRIGTDNPIYLTAYRYSHDDFL